MTFYIPKNNFSHHIAFTIPLIVSFT